MQSNEDHSSNIVTADDHRNISAPDETTPPTQSGRELSSPYKYCRYFFPRCFGLIGYFLFLLVEVVTFILRITYFWLTVIPLYSWKVKCAKDLTHGGQASNETSPDFYLSLPVTKLFNQSSREMFHVFIIAFKSIENIKEGLNNIDGKLTSKITRINKIINDLENVIVGNTNPPSINICTN